MDNERSLPCERDPVPPVDKRRRMRWLEENRAAMDAWNAYVAKEGLPLDEYRQF